MTPRLKIAFVVIVAAQVLVLIGFIADREYTLRTGTDVVLQTVPIDPRSLFQGDYVILDYEIATAEWYIDFPVGQTLYLSLSEAGEVWEAESYGESKPPGDDAVFIKGTIDRPGHLDFGIGTYFVPEATGLLVERTSDVKVVASVDDRGKAVIKDVLLDGVPFSEARKLKAEAEKEAESETGPPPLPR